MREMRATRCERHCMMKDISFISSETARRVWERWDPMRRMRGERDESCGGCETDARQSEMRDDYFPKEYSMTKYVH